MLSFAFPESPELDNARTNRHYKHPASVWGRSSKANYEWLLIHGIAQCEEYTRRYKRRHASQDAIEYFAANYHKLSFPSSDLTPFARCFGPFKQQIDASTPDTIQAYRLFYYLDKKEFAKWPSLDEIPEWWEKDEKYVDKNFKNGVYTKR